jgi:hypothetical protein
MPFIKKITATSMGLDAGPFNIYHTTEVVPNLLSDVNGNLLSGVSRSALLAGIFVSVPDDANLIIVRSAGACKNSVQLNVGPTPPPSATYSITPASSSVTEGSSINFNIGTTLIVDGTILYWTITGVATAPDFVAVNGSAVINNNTGTITVNTVDDSLIEGSETFSVQLRTGSINGPIVATSSPVTIIDNSTSGGVVLTFLNYVAGKWYFGLSQALPTTIEISFAEVFGYVDVCGLGDAIDAYETDMLGGTGAVTILAGQLQGDFQSLVPMTSGVNRFVMGQLITVAGYGTFSNGQTFNVGGITVTVVISSPSDCLTYNP